MAMQTLTGKAVPATCCNRAQRQLSNKYDQIILTSQCRITGSGFAPTQRRSFATCTHTAGTSSRSAGRCRAVGSIEPEEEDEEILTKEEDWVVPGGYQDSLSSNTPLGRAIRDACDELDNLGSMERETIEEANKLLAKLGYRPPEQQSEGGTDS